MGSIINNVLILGIIYVMIVGQNRTFLKMEPEVVPKCEKENQYMNNSENKNNINNL